MILNAKNLSGYESRPVNPLNSQGVLFLDFIN